MKVISIINQKGGVGKTTTTLHLGATLALKKKSVLLIDFDKQRNLTAGFNIPYDYSYNVSDFLSLKDNFKISKKGNRGELYVMAGAKDYDITDRFSLKKAIDSMKKTLPFDFVLIDCPPAVLEKNYISPGEAALVASDFVLVPLLSDKYSIEGLADFMPSIIRIKENYNDKLELLGIFLNIVMTNETSFSDYYKGIKEHKILGDFLLKTYIRKDINIKKAQELGKTIFEYDAKSRAAIDYENLYKEIIKDLK